MACRIIKRKTSSVMKGQDDEVRDTLLHRMMFETVDTVKRDDPAHEDWCMDGRELNM